MSDRKWFKAWTRDLWSLCKNEGWSAPDDIGIAACRNESGRYYVGFRFGERIATIKGTRAKLARKALDVLAGRPFVDEPPPGV